MTRTCDPMPWIRVTAGMFMGIALGVTLAAMVAAG